MIEHVAILERIQARAATEPRDHLVALVEYAFGFPPEQAERLIPRAGSIRMDSRVDCEKPIRDENGKFLGCEPGEGSGGAGESAPAESAPRAPESHVERETRLLKTHLAGLRERIKPTTEQQAAIAKHIEENPFDDKDVLESAMLEKFEGEAKVAKALERGHLKPIPTKMKEAHAAVAKSLAEKRDRISSEVESEGRAAQKLLADVRALTDDDDGEEFDDPGEMFEAMGEFAGVEFGESSSAMELPSFDPEDEPDKFSFDDEDIEEGETKAAAKTRQKDAHDGAVRRFEEERDAYAKAKAQLPLKVKAARDKLQALHDKQVAGLDEVKALNKEEAKARRASEKEMRAAAEVDTSKFSTSEDGEEPTDPKELAEYEEALAAVSYLEDEAEIDDQSVETEDLKASAKATAEIVKNLTKYLVKNGHEKAAPKTAKPKKAAAKKPAKAKAAEVDEDEDEDIEEEEVEEDEDEE